MRYSSHIAIGLLLVLSGLFSPGLRAATTLVKSQAEYADAAENLKPGDTIVLANGVWKDFEILFTGEGDEDNPITLKAEEKGKVIISGKSNLRLAGEYRFCSQ